jgi:hypothetical protein
VKIRELYFSKANFHKICQSLVSMCVNIFQVYEYITYDANKHISLASLPGMQERTIITSSLSKTYSVTGEHNSEFAARFVVTINNRNNNFFVTCEMTLDKLTVWTD